MASRSTVLIAKDISKSYGDRIIIDHLSLTVHEGKPSLLLAATEPVSQRC